MHAHPLTVYAPLRPHNFLGLYLDLDLGRDFHKQSSSSLSPPLVPALPEPCKRPPTLAAAAASPTASFPHASAPPLSPRQPARDLDLNLDEEPLRPIPLSATRRGRKSFILPDECEPPSPRSCGGATANDAAAPSELQSPDAFPPPKAEAQHVFPSYQHSHPYYGASAYSFCPSTSEASSEPSSPFTRHFGHASTFSFSSVTSALTSGTQATSAFWPSTSSRSSSISAPSDPPSYSATRWDRDSLSGKSLSSRRRGSHHPYSPHHASRDSHCSTLPGGPDY